MGAAFWLCALESNNRLSLNAERRRSDRSPILALMYPMQTSGRRRFTQNFQFSIDVVFLSQFLNLSTILFFAPVFSLFAECLQLFVIKFHEFAGAAFQIFLRILFRVIQNFLQKRVQ